MATEAAAGRMKHEAEARVFEVLGAHAPAELVSELEALGAGTPRDPWHLAAYQAKLIEGLAGIIEGQERQLLALQGRVAGMRIANSVRRLARQHDIDPALVENVEDALCAADLDAQDEALAAFFGELREAAA